MRSALFVFGLVLVATAATAKATASEVNAFLAQLDCPAPPAADVQPPATAPEWQPVADCIPKSRCCKVCDSKKSRACGDSCISKGKDCNVGRGCACNSFEVCAG